MHSKNNRQNHDFQIAYFLAGRCHTPDGAYAMLCDLAEDRERAIDAYHVSQKRSAAKKMRAVAMSKTEDEAARLEAEADLLEIDNAKDISDRLYEACKAEIVFIRRCMIILEEHRVYKHLPLPQAHEAMQQEEWRLELIHRAENFIMCQGVIPPDELSHMRAHPAFATSIWPEIKKITEAARDQKVETILMHPSTNVIALIEQSLITH